MFDTVAARLEGAAVSACLKELSAPQRDAIHLAFYTGMTYSEVAAHLSTPSLQRNRVFETVYGSSAPASGQVDSSTFSPFQCPLTANGQASERSHRGSGPDEQQVRPALTRAEHPAAGSLHAAWSSTARPGGCTPFDPCR